MVRKKVEKNEPELGGLLGRKSLRLAAKAWTGGFETKYWHQEAQELGPGGQKTLRHLRRYQHERCKSTSSSPA